MKIEIDKCVYNVHPIYNLYASDKNGNINTLPKEYLTKETRFTMVT